MSWVRFEPRDEASSSTNVLFGDGGTCSVLGAPADVLAMIEEADDAGLASVPFELAPHGQLAVLAVDEIERLS